MYMRAWGFSEKLAMSETKKQTEEFWRRNRAAAGIEPRASARFILQTKLSVLLRGGRRRGFVRLAIRMNRDLWAEIWPPIECPWSNLGRTPHLKVFIDNILPGLRFATIKLRHHQTPDIHIQSVALYQLSYSRPLSFYEEEPRGKDLICVTPSTSW